MNALLDILGTVGNVLDTPGSIARGLMAGDPGRAFGGIMDPSQRVSGSEMLGMDPHADLFSGEGMAGLGAEMLADPLNLLGGMGLLKLGKARNLAKASNARRAELLASGGMPEEVAKLTKAVDEAGNPLRTYHGTPNVYDTFDPAKSQMGVYGQGYHAALDPETANAYLRGASGWLEGTPNIRMQHLDVRNPFDIDATRPMKEAQSIFDEATKRAVPHPTLGIDDIRGQMGTGSHVRNEDLLNAVFEATQADPIQSGWLRELGHDSVKYTMDPITGLKQPTYVVPEPSQIYSPWVAPAAQRVPSTSPLLAALGGHNVLRGAGHVMRGNREGLF